MKTATIVRDKISGAPFAVLLGAGQNLRVFGAIGQGDTWAQWFQASNLDSSALDQLDVSLTVEKEVLLSPEYINSISNVFTVENINDIKNIASQKALLVIQHTKSLIGEEPENYEQINETNSEEEINNWPITDAALAAIDVAYKQIAIEYKAKAFNLDINRSSIVLKAKGARAMWDPSMPGGGGWRCPDNTPFGGQFTNRIGRGCTFGVVRRIGRSLMTAALKDITKPLDGSANDGSNVALPKIYKLGQDLDNRGIQNQESLQKKYKARVGRRVEKLQKRKAKEQLKAGAVTWRQAYQSLEPQMSRRGKAKIAAARVAQRIANDTVTSTFNTETRRAQRRKGRIVEKSPIDKPKPDVNNPATIESTPDSESRKSTLRDTLANSLRNNAQNILEGRRINRRKLKDNNSLLADQTEGNLDNSVLNDGSPDDKPKTRLLRRKRTSTGTKPKQPSIVSRFLDNETDSREKEEREIVRQIRGQKPRSTQTLSQRAALRARRTAKARSGETPDLSDYDQFVQNRAFPIRLPRKKKDFIAKFTPEKRMDILGFDDDETDAVLQDFQQSENAFDAFRDERPKASSTNEKLPTSDKWWEDESNWLGLESLNNFFHTYETHAEISRLRQNALQDFDKKNQKKLEKIYLDWLDEYNDPDIDAPVGGGSNMGKTQELVQILKTEGEPSLGDGEDETGYRHTLIAKDLPNNPIVYIGDTDAGVAHLLSKDGRHLLTVVLGDAQSMGRKGKIYFIAGEQAYEKIIKDDLIPTFRERLAGFKKRKQNLDVLPISLRSRQRQFEKSSTRSGLTHAKSTTGKHLKSNISLVNGGIPWFPGVSVFLPETIETELINEAKLLADFYEDEFRKLIKNFDKNTPLTEDEVLGFVDRVGKQDKRKSGVIANNFHNFITLTQIVEEKDVNYIQNLKPELRSRLLEVIEDERDENGESYIFEIQKQNSKGVLVSSREPFAPWLGRNKDGIPNKSKPRITPTTPLTVVDTPEAVASVLSVGAGPKLQLKTDSPELGIVWDAAAGLHRDLNTDQYIEDLSNLEFTVTDVYQPVPLLEMDNYPEIPTTATGVFPTSYIRLAPGADLNGAAGKNINNSEDPRKQVVGLTSSFSSSIREFIRSEFLTSRKKFTSQSEQMARKILGTDKNDYRTLLGTAIAKFNFRGRKSSEFRWTLSELAGLSIESESKEERLSELDGEYLYGADSDKGIFSLIKENGFNSKDLGLEFIDNPFETELNPGVFDELIDEFYLPSYLIGNQEKITNEDTIKLVGAINRALLFDSQIKRVPETTRTDASKMDELSQKADAAWVNAHKVIQMIYVSASRERNNSLSLLNKNPRNKQGISRYLESGAIAETAELLLQEHFINNPRFLRALTAERRNTLERQAAKKNLRKLQAAQRAALRQAGGGIGGRNSGVYDDAPDILDPHGEPNPPPARDIGEIIALVEAHKADSMFVNPLFGSQEITEEQIDVLSNMILLEERRNLGLPGTPYEDIQMSKNAKLAHFWYYNGYNSLPVLISEEELLDAIGQVDEDGLPLILPITRGFGQSEPLQLAQYAADSLRGERFVPGQGGEAVGQGDYYTMKPGNTSWQSYRSDGSTIITLIPKSGNIQNREAFARVYVNPMRTVLSNLLKSMFFRKGPDSGLLNEFAQRTNGAYGNAQQVSLDGGSPWGSKIAERIKKLKLNRDPITGTFSPQQIDKLKNLVAELTSKDKDAPGLFTVEGYFSQIDRQGGGTGINYALWATLMLDIIDDKGPQFAFEEEMIESLRQADLPHEEIPGLGDADEAATSLFSPTNNFFNFPRVGSEKLRNEAFETRQQINAWFGQYLDWYVQLAQMFRDETDNINGTENKKYNKKLFDAMVSFKVLNQDIFLAMHGADGVFADGLSPAAILPSQIWSDLFYDPWSVSNKQMTSNADPDSDRFLLHNRSSAIMLREPVTNRKKLGEKIDEIMNPKRKWRITRKRGWRDL